MSKARKRKKKSSQWFDKHSRDQYVRASKQQGLRARSAFKLKQIDQKYRLIRPAFNIVDLGATPGSWSQYAASIVNSSQAIVAVDLLPMQAIDKVHFIQGDFLDPKIQSEVIEYFNKATIDLVISDIAPNITGIPIVDQSNTEQIQDAILSFCLSALTTGGGLLTKLFTGENLNNVRQKFKPHFRQLQMIKPDASRSQSKEVYLLARQFISEQR